MWLLEKETEQRIETAVASGFTPTTEQQERFTAFLFGAESNKGPRILSINGETAVLNINGVMTESPDIFAMIFGGGNTTYQEITEAVEAVKADDDIKRVQLKVNSTGGHISGLFGALDALKNIGKPVETVVGSVAASAGYAVAAQGGKITAANRGSRIGSIGVAAEFYTDDKLVQLASTMAPKKRPDLKTEAGRAAIIEELDEIHSLFVDSIATGRGTTTENINANFGQGGTFLADRALQAGMIDAILQPAPTASRKKPQEVNSMDLNTLKAQHPDVFNAAVQEGVTQERKRVTAHLIMGKSSGDMETAMSAIESGDSMDEVYHAKYLSAGLNKKDIDARTGDNPDDIDPKPADSKGESQSVLAAVAANMGVEV